MIDLREASVTCLQCGYITLKTWPDNCADPGRYCSMTCRCCNNLTNHEWELVPRGTLCVTEGVNE